MWWWCHEVARVRTWGGGGACGGERKGRWATCSKQHWHPCALVMACVGWEPDASSMARRGLVSSLLRVWSVHSHLIPRPFVAFVDQDAGKGDVGSKVVGRSCIGGGGGDCGDTSSNGGGGVVVVVWWCGGAEMGDVGRSTRAWVNGEEEGARVGGGG